MTLLRRFLVLAALMFWQGGFVFYAAVVVPVGTDVLGGKLQQGFITWHVAGRLNLAGAVCLVPLTWDVLVGADPSARRRRLRCVTCAGLLLGLAALVWLHPRMDELLRDEGGAKTVLDSRSFRVMHKLYLWVSTAQWALSVAYAALTLWAWRDADRKEQPPAA